MFWEVYTCGDLHVAPPPPGRPTPVPLAQTVVGSSTSEEPSVGAGVWTPSIPDPSARGASADGEQEAWLQRLTLPDAGRDPPAEPQRATPLPAPSLLGQPP